MIEIRDPYRRRIHKKTLLLVCLLLAWFLIIAGRLVDLQVLQHSRLKAQVIEQNSLKSDIIPKRGNIFDRNGIVLALSLPLPSVFYVPLKDEPAAGHRAKINRLKKALSLTDKDIQKIMARVEDHDTFVWIKRTISQAEYESVKRLAVPGISFREENKRFYPLGPLAAHVLGGVGVDDVGLSGVELKYNELLKGINGQSQILWDARKRKYQIETLKDPKPGKPLTLTIDQIIQHSAERELRRAVEETRANWGTVVISNPASGEILAMAGFPTYDPNAYPDVSREAEVNRAVRHNFEPGSTFKIVTAAAAREYGASRLTDTFDCREGKIRVAGWTIEDHEKLGVLTFPEVFIHSSNVGSIQVGLRLARGEFYNAIQAFGFGRKTEVGLPGEEKGILRPVDKWSKTSLAALSIGYEVSVTAVQVLQALNVIANRGFLIPLRIVKETPVPAAGPAAPGYPAPRIVSERTAAEVKDILERAVAEGTGREAVIEGFSIAGKTGTAQKIDPALGGYSARKHLSAFAGFVPSEKPLLSMVIILDEPKGTLYYGGQVAAPLFRDIARNVLLYLREPPREIPKAEAIIAARLPDRRTP